MTALFLAQRYGDRFDRIFPCDCGPASTPQSAQQWKERIDLGAEKGMEALVDQTINRWFPPEFQSPPRRRCVDKVRNMIRTTPVRRLRRLRLGAVGLRHQARARRHQEPDAVHLRHQGRDLSRHPGDQRRGAGLEAGQHRRRRPHLPMSSSPTISPRRSGISSRAERKRPPSAATARSITQVMDRGRFPRRTHFCAAWTLPAAVAKKPAAIYVIGGAARPVLGRKRPRFRRPRACRPGGQIMTLQEPEIRPGISNKARELMEAINTDAGKDNIWVRTQMNAPSQRAWFADPSGHGHQGNGPRRHRPDEERPLPLALEGIQSLSRPPLPHRGGGRRAADRVRRPAVDPAHQSRPRRPPAGDQHHPLRDLDLQSRRHRPRARAFAERQPHHPVGQGRLHQCRRRALRSQPRRHHPDAERHLARPRQRGQGAGDLDRHAGLAADGVPGLRLGRPGVQAGHRQQPEEPGHDPDQRLLGGALRQRRPGSDLRLASARLGPRAGALHPLPRRSRSARRWSGCARRPAIRTKASRCSSSTR